MSSQRLFRLGAALAGLAVAIGAFGAHALKAFLYATNQTATFETAVKYQMYHGLALLVLGLAGDRLPAPSRRWVGLVFMVGVVLFSGSLYALCLLELPMLGAVTPIGGLCLLAGWGILAWRGLKL